MPGTRYWARMLGLSRVPKTRTVMFGKATESIQLGSTGGLVMKFW